MQTLHDLQCEGAADAAGAHRFEDAPHLACTMFIRLIAPIVRELACSHSGRDTFGQPAQVLKQHHPQRCCQSPQFPQGEFAYLLVGRQESAEQSSIERTVVVRDEGPSNTINTGQTCQMRVREHGQIAKELARHAVVNFFELRHDDVEVVEQPLARRADVMTGELLQAHVALCFAQDPDVLP